MDQKKLQAMFNREEHAQEIINRAETLLRATYELLNKQNETIYVLDMLEETVFYDGAECDGSCLMEDIEAWFESGV